MGHNSDDGLSFHCALIEGMRSANQPTAAVASQLRNGTQQPSAHEATDYSSPEPTRGERHREESAYERFDSRVRLGRARPRSVRGRLPSPNV